jgi:hypothetical protein
LGQKSKTGSSCQLSTLIASSKCCGHVLGISSAVVLLYSSLPRFGKHSCFSMWSRSLLAPFTNLFTQGEYATTTHVSVPHFAQNYHTSWLLKCFPPSDMNVSDGAKSLKMLDSPLTIVFMLLAVLYLNPHMCCKQVLRYSPMVWNPPAPLIHQENCFCIQAALGYFRASRVICCPGHTQSKVCFFSSPEGNQF